MKIQILNTNFPDTCLTLLTQQYRKREFSSSRKQTRISRVNKQCRNEYGIILVPQVILRRFCQKVTHSRMG
jgi:hypothetical protein